MTAEEARAIGRRWVSAGGGRLPGALYMSGQRMLDDGTLAPPREPTSDASDYLPDFRDGATRGSAVEHLRVAAADPYLTIINGDGPALWWISCSRANSWVPLDEGGWPIDFASEPEAIIAAREALGGTP